MGFCLSCCRGSEPAYVTPSDEERRQKMIEAAERRRLQEERKGIKDPDHVRWQQERSRIIDEARDQSDGDGKLRWQVS